MPASLRMTHLEQLIIAVKERNLSKEKLEEYRDDFATLYAQIMIEKADLEKAEALFILASELKTSAGKKEAWRGTEKGQRLIELDHYSKACEKMISSLKSRLYSIY